MNKKVSVILPARNEGKSLELLLPKFKEINGLYDEIIIVNDGSDDDTLAICNDFDVKVISHPYPKGNGAAIKSGARAASGEIFVFMDADSQHSPEDIDVLLEKLDSGYDMVVGARDFKSHTSIPRYIANVFYNYMTTWMTGHKIDDLTSGFRAVKAKIFKKYLYLLPNGFSYPTTITMAILRNGYSLAYMPIKLNKREGTSHIKPIQDGIRFLLIIFKIGTLYSPLKLFAPISLFLFLSGVSNYFYTYFTQARFTNMSALLLIVSVLIFSIGLLSEQLTTLMYSERNSEDNK